MSHSRESQAHLVLTAEKEPIGMRAIGNPRENVPLNAQVRTTLMPAFAMLWMVALMSSSVFNEASQYALVPRNLKGLC